jgi:hypothetical protein
VKTIEARSEEATFECTGVACVASARMRAPPPTRTRAYLLNDGPRHAVFLDDDAEAARILALPTDCAPRFLTYAGGLVVLVCKDALFASTADARWAERFTLGGELALHDFEMASDGTAMFAHYGDGASRAIVRAPVALGANAWRDVTHPSALAYALRDGGGVDVIIGDGDLLTLIEDTPLARKHVLTRVAVGDLWCIGRKDGRIVGIRRKPSMTFERIILEPRGVIVDSPLLDGSGATDPTGACGF